MNNILLFASGGGSNVKAILENLYGRDQFNFPLIVTNNPKAGVINIAREYKIEVLIITREMFASEVLMDTLEVYKPHLLVLAGFLWKLPDHLIQHFPNRIINIHPSLLPKYGGKGMYGHYVHEAVVANKETETGITIHLVNEHYDEGRILLQKKVDIEQEDTAEEVAQKVLALEHVWYSSVIESFFD